MRCARQETFTSGLVCFSLERLPLCALPTLLLFRSTLYPFDSYISTAEAGISAFSHPFSSQRFPALAKHDVLIDYGFFILAPTLQRPQHRVSDYIEKTTTESMSNKGYDYLSYLRFAKNGGVDRSLLSRPGPRVSKLLSSARHLLVL